MQGFQATQATEPSTPFAESDFVRKHSPYYNASHRCFRSAVRLFVDAEIVPTCVEDDENGEATCTTPPTPKMLYTRNILKVDFSTNDVLSNTRADESNGSYYGTV